MSLTLNNLPKKQEKKLVKLLNEANSLRVDTLRRIFFAASTLLGILISLYQKPTSNHQGDWVLAFSVLLLGLSILSIIISLRSRIKVCHKLVARYAAELIKASMENRKPDDTISFETPKIVYYSERCAYIFLGLAILGLSSCVLITVLFST